MRRHQLEHAIRAACQIIEADVLAERLRQLPDRFSDAAARASTWIAERGRP